MRERGSRRGRARADRAAGQSAVHRCGAGRRHGRSATGERRQETLSEHQGGRDIGARSAARASARRAVHAEAMASARRIARGGALYADITAFRAGELTPPGATSNNNIGKMRLLAQA